MVAGRCDHRAANVVAGVMGLVGVLALAAITVGTATALTDGTATFGEVWWRLLIGLFVAGAWASAAAGLRSGQSLLVGLGALTAYGLSAAAAVAAACFGFGVGTSPDYVAAAGQAVGAVLLTLLARYLKHHASCLSASQPLA